MTSPATRPRVGMISLGCPKNRVDSEVMLGELTKAGYELAATIDDADTVIVNTCGFIEEANQQSIDAILEVAGRKHEGKRLLVAGCMVNRYGPELAESIPEIDGFVGLDDLRQISQVVQIGAAAPLPAPSHVVFDHTAPRTLPGSQRQRAANPWLRRRSGAISGMLSPPRRPPDRGCAWIPTGRDRPRALPARPVPAQEPERRPPPAPPWHR